ncbi:hypothetical protein DFH09DRAFT_1333454 [Mycena vulgaris]|nr:hypothetical protein DFH09DRAFT_1333454 [Mycena vulgaris]
MLCLLFPCCIRPLDDDSADQVIPNETSRLIPASAQLPPPGPPEMTVDHQKLNDRLSTIVRAKEGKMVNVISRTPFTLRSVHDNTSSPASPISPGPTSPSTPASTSAALPEAPVIPASSTLGSRRPTVLTMTPAALARPVCGQSLLIAIRVALLLPPQN